MINKKTNPKLQHRLGKGFWKNATPDQKLIRYREMFDDKVIENDEGCWGWKSFLNSTGSGMLGVVGSMISAYRLSYILHKGPIPQGLLVLHKCHNRICTRPDHLYLGTNKDNTRDMIEAGRNRFSKQHSLLCTKLNPEKVSIIKRLLREGELTQQVIANKFGVSRGTVQDIKRNKMWRNIE